MRGFSPPPTPRNDIRAVGEMRHERVGQHEWTKVVGRERQVPALGVPRGAHLENAGIVEQAGDRKPEGDDLRCRALAFSLDGRRISSSFLASRPTSTIVPCLARGAIRLTYQAA